MKVVVCAGSQVPQNGVHLTLEAAAYLLYLLNEVDPPGKLAFNHITEDSLGGGYIVTLPRHHPELVKVIEVHGSMAGQGDCCPMVIDVPLGGYIIYRSGNLEFICDPDTKKQL